MRYPHHLLALVCGLFITIFSSCQSKPDETKTKPPKTTAAPAAPTLTGINFVLETSASMGGYLTGQTEFKDVISDLVTKVNDVKPVSLYTISTGKPQPVSGDVNTFVGQMATTKLATGKSSELHRIFQQVGQLTTGNKVAIFVSDCILSFPDADIKNNPEVNRINASSTLKSNIYSQFREFSKQDISVTVYAFNSAFNGTYYTYQNQKQKLTGEKRPFYVWVLGKQSLVAEVNRQLGELLSEKPAERIDFGTAKPLTKYDLLFSLNKKGDWRASNNNVTDIKSGRKTPPAEFAIGIDAATLPAYAHTDSYIRQNLSVSANNGTVKLVSVQPKTAVKTDRLNANEQKLLNQDTEVLTFRTEKLFDDETTLHLTLPVRYDTWYTNWSTMDDRTADGRKGKTFAFNYLLTGVKEAYQSGSNTFMDITIKLTKN